jgi:predicted DNA-binding transcriptional regulator YafY
MAKLIDECNKAVCEYDPNSDCNISVRTFRNDIKYLREIARQSYIETELEVDLESKPGPNGYWYSYSRKDYSIYTNELSDSEINQLKAVIFMLGRFKGLPEFDEMEGLITRLEDKFQLRGNKERVIGYDQNENYVGSEILTEVFTYTINKQVLKVLYSPFADSDKEWIIHPYFIKEYNNRWFLFGYSETEGRIINAALDRIRDIQPTNRNFIPNDKIDFETYFDNVAGVTVNDKPIEKIILKASKYWLPYLETKQIHKSQVVTDRTNGILKIEVIPNNELDALILSFGNNVEVLSPADYRDHIKEIIAKTSKIYSGV